MADWYGNALLVFDAHSLQRLGSVPAGRAPAGIVVSDDNARVYVAARDDDAVTVVDAAELKPVGSLQAGSHPFALGLGGEGRRLWALNVLSDDVSVFDLRDGRELARIRVGKAPYGIAFDESGQRAFVTNQHAASLSVIDTATLQVLATWPACDYPEGIEVLQGRAFVVSWMEDALCVHDAASGARLAQIPLGSNPRGFGRFVDPR